jgi:glycosyltransferase involved in cell wall biosynthesis
MRVGFLNNQIDNRGTGNALFDYAHYNETILGNKSFIFVLNRQNYDEAMGSRLTERFGAINSIWDVTHTDFNIDVLYHIKSGEEDGTFNIPGVRYVVHAVFHPTQPHGDRYATISRWMADQYHVQYVPHIVHLSPPVHDMRLQYGIPRDAFVYGRHGGSDTFDVFWAWKSINRALEQDKNIYFMFMNTDNPIRKLYDPKRVIFLPPTANKHYKSSFIWSCDAMLHARLRGETFGIAVGEFALAGKPVLTYGASGERAHIEQLGPLGFTYFSPEELTELLLKLPKMSKPVERSYYDENSPKKVMTRFKEVFLD